MRQCGQCNFYAPDDAQFCANCGNSLIPSPTVTSTMPSQPPGRPPEASRQRKYTHFIPGLAPFGLSRDPVTGQWGCAPGCLIISILIAILSLGGFLFLHNSSSNKASLSVDHAVPGGTMHVHGSNFPPGSSVKITVDENSAASYTLAFVSIGESTLQKKLLRPTDTVVTVQSDGTFDTTIPVPKAWTPGSLHTIRATTQNAKISAQASTDVETELPGQTATVPPTIAPTPTHQPTIPPAQPPHPSVSSLDPSSGPVSGGTSVMINGSGFNGATGVSFGSTAATNVNVVSDKQITAVSPADSGTVDVTVTTPNGTSKTSNADQFTYTITVSPPSAPTVSSLDTASGPTAGGTTVTITGSGFTGATGVSFGSTAGTDVNVVNDTQITVVSPAGSGTVDVTVTTPSGTSQTSSADQFTYTVPLPIVTSISPSSGPMSGGTPVTINGSGFTGATRVFFGSTAATNVNVVSDSQVTATSPGGNVMVDVTVTTPGGTSTTSNADKFTYLIY